jgi:hypothetical protein
MHPPFTEPAEFVLQEKDVFLQLFREESISAWAFQEDAGHWEQLCPELDAKEFNVSARRRSPREATQRVINRECEDPVPEAAESDSGFDWLKAHIENHLGRYAVEDRLVARYLSIFPPAVIQKIAVFPSRQWEMLAAIGRKPELLNLLAQYNQAGMNAPASEASRVPHAHVPLPYFRKTEGPAIPARSNAEIFAILEEDDIAKHNRAVAPSEPNP